MDLENLLDSGLPIFSHIFFPSIFVGITPGLADTQKKESALLKILEP